MYQPDGYNYCWPAYGDIQELSPAQEAALTAWKPLLEGVMYEGSPVAAELNYWLNTMGFFIVGGKLTLPHSSQAQYSTLWSGLESYFTIWYDLACGTPIDQAYSYFSHMGWPYNEIIGTSASIRNDLSALRQFRSDYPRTLSFFGVMNSFYGRVSSCLSSNYAAIKSVVPSYSPSLVLSGLLILFMFFMFWATLWYTDYVVKGTKGTIGPYTATVMKCENGSVWGVTELEEHYHIAHQSVDCELLLQDEAQVELAASQLLSAKVPSELDADIALQARVDTELSAELPLMGEVQLTPIARLALWDTVPTSFDADEWLAATHQFPLDAYERLAAIPRIPLDADICIQGPVPISITARMYLEPDFKSEMLTDLERLHIQKYRIVADPRSYVEYNSEKDVEVVP